MTRIGNPTRKVLAPHRRDVTRAAWRMPVRVVVLSLIALGVLSYATTARAQLPEKRFLTADGARPSGLFAPGVMVGKTVYVAGKGDYRPDEPLEGKVKNCLNEIRKTLQVAGLDLSHVVKSFVYLEDHEQYGEFNKYYGEFFPENPPARTTLGVAAVPGDSTLEITCIAYADPAGRRTVGEPPANFPFSPGVLAGDTLYVSGKGDQLAGGGHPETFEEQVRQAMRNVESTLAQAGLDFRNVVMSHVFLDDYSNLAAAQKVYGEFFEKGNEPACASVFVDWIPGGSHVEVTCIATTDLERRKVVRPPSLMQVQDSTVPASPAVWAGDTLYLSGLSGMQPEQSGETGELSDQVHQMAKNHVQVLEATDMPLESIVSGCVYLRTIDDYRPMNNIYKEYFSRGPGVRTCLMPNASYEKNDILVRASFIAARTEGSR